ncbi:MAG: ABC transporter substrate-binding protein [Candidatus Tectomicrobia bacterium]|nr:ABC transporter substrate-binding protein [Candidatus Tectomicrobia bacterium]
MKCRQGFLGLACVLGVLVWVGLSVGPAWGAERVKIRFAESWVFGGDHVGEFAALGKGWYAEEGAGIDISRGYGGADSYKRAAAGSVDIARTSMLSAVLGRAAGAKVKGVQISMHTSPFGLAYLKGIGIEKPKDLEGRRVAIPSGSSVYQFWPAFAKVNGIDVKRVAIVHMSPAVLTASLASHTVDASDSWLTSLPGFQAAVAQKGREVGHFLWSDYGLTVMYGAGFVASDDTIAKRPEMVQKFVRATARGIAWALQNPDAAVDIFMKYNADRDRSIIAAQWKYMKRLSVDEFFQKNGLGYIDPEKMARSIELTDKYIGLKSPVKAEDVYTNEFIAKVPREWRFPKF